MKRKILFFIFSLALTLSLESIGRVSETEKDFSSQKAEYAVESELFSADDEPISLKLTLKKK